MSVVGIDPGEHGAISWVDSKLVSAVRLPYTKNKRPDCSAIVALFGKSRPTVAIEKQFIVPRRRGEDTKLVAYGILLGLLQGIGCTVYEVTYDEWQNAMAPGAPKADKTDRMRRKRFLVACAKRCFPELDFDEHGGIADALLIAEYWRTLNGKAGGQYGN